MGIGQKILVLREDRGLTQLELAEKSGVSEKTIRRYENDYPNTTQSVLKKLAKGLDVDVEYFSEESILQKSNNSIPITYYPHVNASAGYGAALIDEESKTVHLDKSFLKVVGIRHHNNLEMINVHGDSMEPFISNGETVIIERTTEAKHGDIVIANIAGDLYVKQFQRDINNQMLKLTSGNEHYIDITLQGQEIESLQIIGVVRARIRLY